MDTQLTQLSSAPDTRLSYALSAKDLASPVACFASRSVASRARHAGDLDSEELIALQIAVRNAQNEGRETRFGASK